MTRLRAPVAVGAIALLSVLPACAQDDDPIIDTPVPTESADSALPTSPEVAAPTPTDVDASGTPADGASAPVEGAEVGVSELVGHDWVRLPITEPFPPPSEPRLSFGLDGTVDGFDGCSEWTGEVDVDDGLISYRSETPPTSSCGADQQLHLDNAPFSVVNEDGALRLTLLSRSGAYGVVEYVAIDSLLEATNDAIVGTWQTATGERLALLPDGTARFGPCDASGDWSLGNGQLTIAGFDEDPTQTVACAGGVLGGIERRLVELVAAGEITVDARLDDTRALLSKGPDTALWLLAASQTEPALDLRTGTVYGFAPLTDVDSDFIVGIVDRTAGEPTFESGWYVADRVPVEDVEDEDVEDCFAGRDMRVVQWGDVAFGFLRLEEQDRLWITNVGDTTGFAAATRLSQGLITSAGKTVTTPDGLGVGSTLADLAAAGITVHNLTGADFQPVTDDDEATNAVVNGLNLVTLELDRGTITAVTVTNPGFC